MKLVRNRPRAVPVEHGCHAQAGFTLVEALIAILMFVFGLMAVTNMLLIAASSNDVANIQTATTEAAQQRLEILRNTMFTGIAAGGNLDADVGPPAPVLGGPPAPTAFYEDTYVEGVSWIHTRWNIVAIDIAPAGGLGTPARTVTMHVRSFPIRGTGVGPVFVGAGLGRGTAEFAVVRTCPNQSQAAGCPCAAACVGTP